MKTYTVLLGATVQAYKTITVRARDSESAKKKAKKLLAKDPWGETDNGYIPEWKTIGDFRIVEDSIEEDQP